MFDGDNKLKIKAFENQDLSELSMIEVAHAMLEEQGKEMDFNVLVNEIQDYLGKSDSEIRDRLSRFYTELNTDGSFIPLGNNVWALRSWYAIDEIDEEVVALDELDDEGDRPKKKRKKSTLLQQMALISTTVMMIQKMTMISMIRMSHMTMKTQMTKKMRSKPLMSSLKKLILMMPK